MACAKYPLKKQHRRARYALAAMREMQSAYPDQFFSVYKCGICKMYHVGRLENPTCKKAQAFYRWMEKRAGVAQPEGGDST